MEKDTVIERLEIIDDLREAQKLWEFYEEIFTPLNERTPINQMFQKRDFFDFLVNQKVRKFVVKDKENIIGIGFITDQLELDPWVSIPYFQKYYPDVPIFNIMVIAVRPNRRGGNIAINLLRAMMNEVPPDGCGIFFHSREANRLIPQFAKKAAAGCIEGRELDSEALSIFFWKNKNHF